MKSSELNLEFGYGLLIIISEKSSELFNSIRNLQKDYGYAATRVCDNLHLNPLEYRLHDGENVIYQGELENSTPSDDNVNKIISSLSFSLNKYSTNRNNKEIIEEI